MTVAGLDTAEQRLAFAACIAHVLGDLGTAPPLPDGDDPFPVWRGWLAERGLALVEVADPAGFAMPGYWIALLRERDGGTRPVVMFGVPSGAVFDPSQVELPSGDVEAGWTLASLDLRSDSAQPPAAPGTAGTVEAIYVSPAIGEPMRALDSAEATRDGLAGDRYQRGEGTFSNPDSNGHALTLIEAEALEGITLPDGSRLGAAESRRNLVTRGISLNHLVGKRFRVGAVECIGRRPCEPCAHLQRLTRRGVLRAFVHRGGLRADVLRPGLMGVGDSVVALEPLS